MGPACVSGYKDGRLLLNSCDRKEGRKKIFQFSWPFPGLLSLFSRFVVLSLFVFSSILFLGHIEKKCYMKGNFFWKLTYPICCLATWGKIYLCVKLHRIYLGFNFPFLFFKNIFSCLYFPWDLSDFLYPSCATLILFNRTFSLFYCHENIIYNTHKFFLCIQFPFISFFYVFGLYFS